MRSKAPDRGPDRGNAICIAGTLALLALGGVAVRDIAREAQVGAVERVLRAQEQAAARGVSAPPFATSRAITEPRALVTRALILAREASDAKTGPDRDRSITQAQAAIDDALVARPAWGEARAVAAYVGSLGGTSGAAQPSLQSFAASYVDAPFLRGAAGWRIGYGVAHWAQLSTGTRNDVLNESFWLMGIDATNRGAVYAMLRNSDAYVPFMLRLREDTLRRSRGA